MKVRLTKRFAEMINGVDLSRVCAGEIIDVSPRDAGILLAEEWAMTVQDAAAEQPRRVLQMPAVKGRAEAAERSAKRKA